MIPKKYNRYEYLWIVYRGRIKIKSEEIIAGIKSKICLLKGLFNRPPLWCCDILFNTIRPINVRKATALIMLIGNSLYCLDLTLIISLKFALNYACPK